MIDAPEEMQWQKRRFVKGRTLDPALLNEVTNWARRRLQTVGYPCPNVEAQALIDSEKIELTVTPGLHSSFGTYSTQGNLSVPPQTLDRYTAFIEDDTYDIRLLELTSNRILAEDLYLSSFFDTLCEGGRKVGLVRRLVPAERKLLRFGFGADSEVGPLARASWRITKITEKADSAELSIYSSLREQRFNSQYRHYLSSSLESRLSLVPSVKFLREDESNYESRTFQMGFSVSYSWEEYSFRPEISTGPYWEQVETQRGEGPSITKKTKILSRIEASSHFYEYYLQDPQEGWNLTLDIDSQIDKSVDESMFHKANLRMHALWNLGEFDPPYLVLGWRSHMATFLMGSEEKQLANLAAKDRFFLGGEADLRGFSRKSLPSNGSGLLTIFYHGWELRTGQWFSINIQPLLLVDLAWTGDSSSTINGPFYHTYGFGARYRSPFGALRLTYARGFAEDPAGDAPPPHDQFYFSFGKEF